METNHALVIRTYVRAALLLIALGGFQVAHAVKKVDLSAYKFERSGNSVRIGPNQANNPMSSRALVGTVNLGGSVGQPIGNSGWYVGGNPPAGSAAGTTMLRHGGDTFFAGTKYPFQAGYAVPPASIFEMATAMVGGPWGVALMLASPFLADWINTADPAKVRANPATGEPEMRKLDIERACELSVSDAAAYSTWLSSLNYGDTNSVVRGVAFTRVVGGNCQWGARVTITMVLDGSVNYDQDQVKFVKPKKGNVVEQWLPASMNDIAPYMTKRPDPNIIPELLDKGGDLNLPSTNAAGNPQPTVTGPSEVLGPKEVTKTSDGGTITKQESKRFTTSGNTITNTSTVTTVNTCNAQGACTTTGDTTVTPSPDKDDDPCKANPDTLACAKPDVPEGEIPRSQKDITYTPEDPFGGGACPADLSANLGTLGQTVKVWDWQQTCAYALPLRALVLGLATFAAFLIVMPGKVDT